MFLTILSGHVAAQNHAQLTKAYAQAVRRPPEGLLQSFLVESNETIGLWQVVSLWKSEEAYRAAHKAGLTGTCESLFCDAGVSPERSTYRVAERFMQV